MTIIAHVKFSISNYFKNMSDLNKHFQPKNFSDKVALSSAAWERHDSIVSIPWNVKSDI